MSSRLPTLMAAVAAAPPLKPIRCGQDVSPEVQDAAFHAPEFAHVHHRGKALAARRRQRCPQNSPWKGFC